MRSLAGSHGSYCMRSNLPGCGGATDCLASGLGAPQPTARDTDIGGKRGRSVMDIYRDTHTNEDTYDRDGER